MGPEEEEERDLEDDRKVQMDVANCQEPKVMDCQMY